MKLLIILSATVCGGAEAYAVTIATAAAASGWETHVACPATAGTQALRAQLQAHHVQVQPLAIAEPGGRGVTAIAAIGVRLIRSLLHLRQVQPDVVLVNLPWADHCMGSILACGLLQLPTAVMFHLLPPTLIPLSTYRLRAYTWARQRQQQWLTNANANRHLLADLFQMPSSDIRCIYNGIPTPTNRVTGAERDTLRQQVRQELGVPADSRLLLTTGRLVPQKGYTDLLAIAPDLIQTFPDIRLIWAGDGEQAQELRDRVQAQGLESHILFLGHRSDVPRLLQAADLFVFPTQFEGHPFALLEAMTYGMAIVSSDASSIPEIMTHSVHGLLYPVGDQKSLQQQIDWALRHPAAMQQMAARAQQQVKEFSQTSMVEKTLGVFAALALQRQSDLLIQTNLD